MTSFYQKIALLSPLAILVAILVLRSILLNYSDLVDPTETRYASVAQQMVLDNDWVTPKLPQPEGVVPYMGKPPLHFWLTAASYELFGVSNFTSRLPSLLATIILMATIILFGARFFSRTAGETAALVTIACPLMFFLAGASVLDVTLSACVCASLLCFALYYNQPTHSMAVLIGVSIALGFLIKGPVAIALFVFAIIPFLITQGRLKELMGYHWLIMLAAFVVVAAPWFILSEQASPGFTKYFFWNENLARYFISDYGDRYGGGHVFPRGTSWIMLLLAFMPWTLPVIWGLFNRQTRTDLRQSLKEDQWLTYCLCWGLSPALFFSFGRQLHISYLLPGLPGLALFFIRWTDLHWDSGHQARLSKILAIGAQSIFLAILIWGLTEGISILILTLVLTAALSCFFVYYYSASYFPKRTAQIPRSVLQICLVFFFAIIIATPVINLRKSTNTILKEILLQTNEANLRIGVVTENNYSPYWLSKKWASEGNDRIKIEFISNSPELKDLPKYLLLKKHSESNLAAQVFSLYKPRLTVGKWTWYEHTSST